MAVRRKRKTAPTKRTRKSNSGFLSLLLRFLVVFLILATIALAANFVHYRINLKKTGTKNINSENSLETNEDRLTDTLLLADVIQVDEKIPTSILLGTWVNTDNGAMLTVNHDTYSIDFPSIDYIKPMKGSIVIAKDSFYVLNKHPYNNCNDIRGDYTFKFKENKLRIRKVQDNCKQRASQLHGSWLNVNFD